MKSVDLWKNKTGALQGEKPGLPILLLSSSLSCPDCSCISMGVRPLGDLFTEVILGSKFVHMTK